MHPLAELDHAFVWHPFTQMRDWLRREPIVIMSGHGAVLRDASGIEYLDANSSIWTNIHGHNVPEINAAIERQLREIAHSSALGLASGPAAFLAQKLVQQANPPGRPEEPSPSLRLSKVFFSDDGSTAMEVALKLSHQCAIRQRGMSEPRFLSIDQAYHGDTLGAVSLGHIDLFHSAWRRLLFDSGQVMSPYCYRCPFNQASPERADARTYRKCHWECVREVENSFAAEKQARGCSYAAMVVEPLIQGAAGMIAQPAGWLKRVAEITSQYGAHLIADEVLTGCGRVGPVLACHQEGVQPDFAALAKGLTGGYMPLAATLTTDAVFDAFLGEYHEFKTFFHGHSYTGNQLGSAAALASLGLLEDPVRLAHRQNLAHWLAGELQKLWVLPNVGDIRQAGLIAGIELVRDWRTRTPFDITERLGMRVCEVMTRHGVLTRPIGNVIVLMPPACTTENQVRRMVSALAEAISETLGT